MNKVEQVFDDRKLKLSLKTYNNDLELKRLEGSIQAFNAAKYAASDAFAKVEEEMELLQRLYPGVLNNFPKHIRQFYDVIDSEIIKLKNDHKNKKNELQRY